MTLSDILGFLSLAGYVALLGQASWKTWMRSNDVWGLYDHGFDKMPEVVEYALRYCLNRGFMVITDRNSDHYVLFRKYILRNGDYGLEFGLPAADWSKAYVPTLRGGLTAEGISFREASETYGEVNAFIHVDCGRDINKAVDLARLCFFDLFGLAPDSRFKSSPSNYSIVNDDVDDPDYENPSVCEFWPALRAHWRAKGRPDPNLLMRYLAFTVGLVFCCYPALWAAWFLADGSPPDWQWSIGSIHLAGSHATWVLLLIFGVLLVGLGKTDREFARVSRLRPRTPIDRIAGPLLKYALPLAVITSWMGI